MIDEFEWRDTAYGSFPRHPGKDTDDLIRAVLAERERCRRIALRARQDCYESENRHCCVSAGDWIAEQIEAGQ